MNPLDRRQRKAEALLVAIREEGLTFDEVLSLRAEGWIALARKACTPSPSFATLELVVENLEREQAA